MSSLIMVSPRKTGKIVDGVLDGAKFTQIARTSPPSAQLGLSVHNINFFDGYFLMKQHSSSARFFLFEDPTQGIGDFRNQGTPSLSYLYGMGGVGYGGDSVLVVGRDGASDTNSIAVSYDFGYSWTLVTVPGALAKWKLAEKATGVDGTQAWLLLNGTTSIAKSFDNGATWVRATIPFTANNLATNGTMAVASAPGAVFYWSENAGATWTRGTSSVTGRAVYTSGGYSYVRYVGGRYWAILFSNSSYGVAIMCSYDGKDWFPVGLPDIGVQLSTIIYAEGIYLIIGLNSNSYLSSFDGINWSVNSFPAGWMSGGHGAYGNGKFIFSPYGTSASVPYQVYSWY